MPTYLVFIFILVGIVLGSNFTISLADEMPIALDVKTEEPVCTGNSFPESLPKKGEVEKSGIAYISDATGQSRFVNKCLPYTPLQGMAIFQGDIILGQVEKIKYQAMVVENQTEEYRCLEEPEDTPKLFGVYRAGDRTRWHNGIIPYHISEDVSHKDRVAEAMNHWQDRTSICFKKRNNEEFYLEIINGNGCRATGPGLIEESEGNEMVLSKDCQTGNIIHEIGHVVGLWHEHSRSDSEDHIHINWDNIYNEEIKKQFYIPNSDDEKIFAGYEYDYGSIMHYPSCIPEMSKDPNKPLIIAPKGKKIGQRDGLSVGDVLTVRAMYNSSESNVPCTKFEVP